MGRRTRAPVMRVAFDQPVAAHRFVSVAEYAVTVRYSSGSGFFDEFAFYCAFVRFFLRKMDGHRSTHVSPDNILCYLFFLLIFFSSIEAHCLPAYLTHEGSHFICFLFCFALCVKLEYRYILHHGEQCNCDFSTFFHKCINYYTT